MNFFKKNTKPTLESALAGFRQAIADLQTVSEEKAVEAQNAKDSIAHYQEVVALAEKDKAQADAIAAKVTDLITA